jgi:hypothetical protein
VTIRPDLLTTTLVALTLTLAAPSSLAQDDPQVKKDLGTVIALQGKPCGEVVSLQRQGDDDYVVTCSSGDRYRVYVGADERVIVEKRNKG